MFIGFVESAEQCVVVENVPDAVADLLESDELTVESLREELLLGVKAEGTGVADATDFDVSWIFRWGDSFGVCTSGGFPSRIRSFIVESLMRSNLVVGISEALEHALLGAEVGARRFGGVGFESFVQSLMSAILLRITWGDALVGNAELKPPNVKASETVNAGGGKGRAVVTADGVGEAMFSKQSQEVASDAGGLDVW